MRYSIRCTLPALLLLVVAGAAHAQTASPRRDSTAAARAALIYGDRYALTVRAPDLWTLDTRSGQRQGLQAVFYPDGERWAKSPAVMYCQVVGRGKEIADVRAMVDYDQNRYRNSSPTATVAEQSAMQVNGGKSVLVRRFSGGAKGTIEQVAYIEERTVIVMIILSCRNSEAFDTSLAAFGQLVNSYRFLADDQENILRAIEAAEE